MNGYAVKPTNSFVTKTELKSTPATKENKEMVNYFETHTFSLRVDKDTGKVISKADKKR